MGVIKKIKDVVLFYPDREGIKREKRDIAEWKQSLKEEKATFNRKKRIKILNDAIKQAKYQIKNYQATILYRKKIQKKSKISKSKKYWK